MKSKKEKDEKCPHMIFDELWGEWKCLIHQVRIYPDKDAICKKCSHKKSEKKRGKKHDKTFR